VRLLHLRMPLEKAHRAVRQAGEVDDKAIEGREGLSYGGGKET
jgi:hypothetical protein